MKARNIIFRAREIKTGKLIVGYYAVLHLPKFDKDNPDNPHHTIPMWQKDMAQWVNKHQIFQMTDFYNFEPRKGFKCSEYFEQ